LTTLSNIRKKLWKDQLWSKSFCLVTAESVPLAVLKEYIESQGEKR
jgi:putative transposase